MRLADAPVKRMFDGRMPQEHPLLWWLWAYPDSIQVSQPARYGRSFLSDSIAPDQIALGSVNPVESEASLVLSRESLAGLIVSVRIGLDGNWRHGLATLVRLKRLGSAR